MKAVLRRDETNKDKVADAHSKTNLVSFKSTTTTYWLFPLPSQESLEKLVAELFNCTKMLEEKGIEKAFYCFVFGEFPLTYFPLQWLWMSHIRFRRVVQSIKLGFQLWLLTKFESLCWCSDLKIGWERRLAIESCQFFSFVRDPCLPIDAARFPPPAEIRWIASQ